MFDNKNLNTKKKPNFEYSGGVKKKVIYLEPYYYQGGKWHKLNSKKGVKRYETRG